MKIILASSSENRRQLFERMKFDFEVAHPDCEEILNPSISHGANVESFALEKAQSVYKKYKNEEDILIMGFDSMIWFKDELIGKPKTKKAAFEMLQKFIGHSQQVISGVAILGNNKGKYFEKVGHETTYVKFRSDITNCQLHKYLDFGDWSGKCGAYSILGMGQFLIEEIDGDFQNIVGVPVLSLGKMIQSATGKNPIKVFEVKND